MTSHALTGTKTHTNAVTEQSCDWLHLFGGHGFNLPSTWRASCSWGSMGSHTTSGKSNSENPHTRCQGSQLTPDAAAVK